MILGMTFYQIVWNFLIYSVVGWCVEVIFHALTFHKVINRGFLNGPVCPVYGFGVVVVFGVINVVAGLVGGRSFGEAIIKGGTGLGVLYDRRADRRYPSRRRLPHAVVGLLGRIPELQDPQSME